MADKRVHGVAKRSSRFLRGLVCVLFVLHASPAAPQQVPEKLVYSLSWLGITVGTAIQEISDEGEGRRIVSIARANDWLAAFYPVDDRIESTLAKSGAPFPGESRSYHMRFLEGTRTRDREITFEPERRLAVFRDRISGEKVEVPIAENTYDIYASFYFVRYQPLEVGKSFYLNILDGKKLRRIEVKVLRREKVKVPAGEFATIVVRPMVPSEGVFEGKGGALIWLSDDHRRLPVKSQTKVRVGSVTAVLTGGSYVH